MTKNTFIILTILSSALTLPYYANAEESSYSLNGETYTYDYAFDSFITDIQKYYLYADNLGDLTEYNKQSKASSASLNNNTFYVEAGASIGYKSSDAKTIYKLSGSAAHIALYGDTDSVVSASSNVSYMSGGYIGDLYGAFISINSFGLYGESCVYTKTTLSSVSASDNAIYLTAGTVGAGVEVDGSEALYSEVVGTGLVAAFVDSVNTNSDATFYLDNNSVNISGGKVVDVIGQSLENGALSGAYLSTVLGEAIMSNNSVNIEAGDVQADSIFGATFYTKSLSSIAENLFKVHTTDYQSYIYEDLGFDTSVATSTSATMFNNSVNISSLDETMYFKMMAGAYASVTNTATLYNNSVNITGGTFDTYLIVNNTPSHEGFIAGAYALLTTPMGAAKGDNGWWNYTYGGTVTASVYGNSVNITGGEIRSIIAGAIVKAEIYSSLGLLVDNLNYKAEISNNTVSIYGGTIKSITNDNTNYSGIYGALYQGSDKTNGSSYITNSYSITNNTVTIGLDAIIDDEYLSIGGGAYSNDSSVDIEFFTLSPDANAFDGNTFHLDQITNALSISTMANFENYIFTLGAENKAGDVLITLSGTLYLGNGYESPADGQTQATKYASIEINVTADNTLVAGDSITLISATSIDGVIANDGETVSCQSGLLEIDWTINQLENSITATYEKTYTGDSAKALAESSLSNSTLVNTGADFIADGIMNSTRSDSSKSSSSNSSGANASSVVSGFASTSGGSSRYNTGSHVDIDSVNIATGIAANFERALLGAFVEAGYGSYDTYNDGVVGSGNSAYYGVGLFGKMEFGQSGDFSPYVQASISGGLIDNSYALQTRSASYDNDDFYISSHIGAGVLWQCCESIELDLNLKYFYSYLDSSKTTASTLDTLDFSSVNSHRLRLSASASYSFNKSCAMYLLAGVEEEFDGASNVSVNGYKSQSPSLSGTTGILGIGFKGNIADSGFSYDFNIQGYAGLRDGFSANLGLGYEF